MAEALAASEKQEQQVAAKAAKHAKDIEAKVKWWEARLAAEGLGQKTPGVFLATEICKKWEEEVREERREAREARAEKAHVSKLCPLYFEKGSATR